MHYSITEAYRSLLTARTGLPLPMDYLPECQWNKQHNHSLHYSISFCIIFSINFKHLTSANWRMTEGSRLTLQLRYKNHFWQRGPSPLMFTKKVNLHYALKLLQPRKARKPSCSTTNLLLWLSTAILFVLF
nr:uncharacterized protein LOC106689546 [Halyomorpha halys]